MNSLNPLAIPSLVKEQLMIARLRNDDNGEVRRYPYLSEVEKTDIRWDALGAGQLEVRSHFNYIHSLNNYSR